MLKQISLRTINGGKGTQTWPLKNVQTKTQSHSTNKVGTEYGPTHVLTKTQLQQISLRTNNKGEGPNTELAPYKTTNRNTTS